MTVLVQDDHDPTTAEKLTCPECSALFSGRAFLNFHLKKAHPNLRVIIQAPAPAKVTPPPPKKVSTQGCQTKEDSSNRVLPPEIASRIIKFSGGNGVKQMTLNGYGFIKNKVKGHLLYWRCKFHKECSCCITENSTDSSFKRSTLGWATDGITHLSHPPDFQKYVRK
jgi:hypothetical protein